MQKFSSKQIFIGALLTPLILGLIFVLFVFNKSFSFGGGDNGVHIRGSSKAALKIVEYSDFQCPFCERHYPNLKRLLSEYGDKISLEYKHFPLSFHPFAEPAAEASECAAEQGKFWEFHDIVFENQDKLSQDELSVWAKQIGLNMNKFNDCFNNHKYQAKVKAEYNQGSNEGVQGTPATFIDGQQISGAVPYEQLKAAVDAALK